MTDARIKSAPASGHALTDRLLDPLYAAYGKGEPIDVIPALVLFKVTGNGGHDTANGRINHVQLEAMRIEVSMEPADREDMIWKIQSLYEGRTSTGSQRPLPIGLAGEERRVFLIERIEEHWTTNGMSGADGEQQWRTYWGIEPDKDWSWGDRGTPADYRNAGIVHLLEFALEIGAEKPDDDKKPATAEDELLGEMVERFGVGEDSLATPDDDPLAAEAEAPAAETPKRARKPKGAAVPSTEE